MNPKAGISALTIALLALAILFTALPARAGGVVGNGTLQSCTYAAFSAALAGGGRVTFNCGSSPHTIVVTKTAGVIPLPNTTIDGGGRITLSGNGVTRLFTITTNLPFTLTNLTLSDAYSNDDVGGAILNRGHLVLDHVVIQNSMAQTPTRGGGAIYNFYGATLLVRSSILRSNTSASGGAIYNEENGLVMVENSQITGNFVDGIHGGGILNKGRLVMTNTLVANNTLYYNDLTPGLNGGGGVSNLFTGRATLANVTINNNLSWDDCGAILNRGLLAVAGGALTGNSAFRGDGGAICNDKTQPFDLPMVSLTNVTVSDNAATDGGALINDMGVVNLIDVTLSDNAATSTGGGIRNYIGTVYLTRGTLSGNSAPSGGGLWTYLGATDLVNATLSGNSATATGGGLYNSTSLVTLTNVTLSGNSAAIGGGIYNLNDFSTRTHLRNTILANGLSGGNCQGKAAATSRYSLSSDSTCALTGAGDVNNVAPLLTPLGNYGGPMQVHMLQAGSPAIDAGENATCPATDQRGAIRPIDGNGNGSALCDIGAIEYGSLAARAGGPYTVFEGSSLTLNGGGSIGATAYAWDLDNDGLFDDAAIPNPTFSAAVRDDGVYPVSLRISNGLLIHTHSSSVKVLNVAPQVSLLATAQSIMAGQAITFTGSFVDPGVLDTHTVQWNFGDGSPLLVGSLTRSHIYHAAGTHHVALTVLDDDGGSGQAALPITVLTQVTLHTSVFLPLVTRNSCASVARYADVVLALDTSSSMNLSTTPGGPTKLAAAKAAATHFLNRLVFPGDQAALVAYDDVAGLEHPLSENRATLLATLQALEASGITRMDLGLAVSRAELTGPRHRAANGRAVVFLTDGRPNGTTEEEVLNQAALTKASGITIYTIGLGGDVNAALLQQMASSPDRYYFSPTTEQLTGIYERIVGIVRCQ